MYKQILSYFPHQDNYQTYIEPFGGAASLLFRKEPSQIEIYNDLEENVYSLFKVLSDKTLFMQFKEKCDLTYYSEQIRKEYIQSLRNDNLCIVDRAYKYFVVNRTSHNGIGGFSLNLAVRRNMSKSVSDMLSTIDGLDMIHQRLSMVVILNQDAIELIKKFDDERVFIYLDPPYHHDTRTSARYKVDMNNEQQAALIDVIGKSKSSILLSGYDNDDYSKLLTIPNWHKIDFTVKVIDGRGNPKNKTESLWLNYNIQETQNQLLF